MVRSLAFGVTTNLVGHLALVPERIADPAFNVHRVLGNRCRRGESVRELEQGLQVIAREPCIVPEMHVAMQIRAHRIH